MEIKSLKDYIKYLIQDDYEDIDTSDNILRRAIDFIIKTDKEEGLDTEKALEVYENLEDEDIYDYYDGILISISKFKGDMVVFKKVDEIKYSEQYYTVGIIYNLGKFEGKNKDVEYEKLDGDFQTEIKRLDYQTATLLIMSNKQSYARDITKIFNEVKNN